MLVAVTLFCVLCGFFGARTLRATRESFAVAEIQRMGGSISYESSQLFANDGWLTRIVAFILYEDLACGTGVSLDGTMITDLDVIILKSLKQLKGVDLSSTTITDKSLAVFSDMPSLKYVNANNTPISESAVLEFKKRRPSLLIDQ